MAYRKGRADLMVNGQWSRRMSHRSPKNKISPFLSFAPKATSGVTSKKFLFYLSLFGFDSADNDDAINHPIQYHSFGWNVRAQPIKRRPRGVEVVVLVVEVVVL
jgi:hypothetical protein